MLRCLASAAALRAAPLAAASLSSEILLGSMPSGQLVRGSHGYTCNRLFATHCLKEHARAAVTTTTSYDQQVSMR